MRVIVDVNVWISALLWQGIPRQILLLGKAKKITIFANPALWEELVNTIKRRKFEKRFSFLGVTPNDVLESAKELLIMTPNLNIKCEELRDQKDLIILSAAVSAKANFLITGDEDLLVLNEYQGIYILTPQDFLIHFVGKIY